MKGSKMATICFSLCSFLDQPYSSNYATSKTIFVKKFQKKSIYIINCFISFFNHRITSQKIRTTTLILFRFNSQYSFTACIILCVFMIVIVFSFVLVSVISEVFTSYEQQGKSAVQNNVYAFCQLTRFPPSLPFHFKNLLNQAFWIFKCSIVTYVVGIIYF